MSQSKFEDKKVNRLFRSIAKKHKLDYRIVRAVILSQFKYVKKVVIDPCELRPVRLGYFGAFDIKFKKLRLKMASIKEVLFENISDVAIMMATTLGFQVKDFESAKKIIEEAIADNDYTKLEMIWDGWLEYNK